MQQLYEDLIVNIAHLKCLVTMNEVEIARCAKDETKELLAKISRNNKTMREHLDEITIILHKILG